MQDDDPLADQAMLAPEVLAVWQRARTGMLTVYPDRSLSVGRRLRASDLEAALPRLRAFVETTVRPQEADWRARLGRDGLIRQIDDAGACWPAPHPMAACGTLDHHPGDPRVLMRALVAVGRANLSAGRLFEGHVNAVKLLHLHGGPTDGIAQGELRGVWAPTGPIPRISGTGSCTGRSCSPAAPMCWTGSSSP